MNWTKAFSSAVAVSSATARALLLLGVVTCTVGCADTDDHQTPPGAEGGAAGEGGSPEPAAGESGMGGAGAAPAGGGHAGANPQALCSTDSDCDDGLYCNGSELCKLLPDSQIKVCMGPEHGPCAPSICYESEDKCDCSNPDRDHDGFEIASCTTGEADCDDDDGDRYPDREEICDGDLMHDEDCNEDTFGTDDVDGDHYFDQACANKRFYQPLFLNPPIVLTVHGSDCKDARPDIHPGAEEVCDSEDNNCNGEADEISGRDGIDHTFYRDLDGDQYGVEPLKTLCASPPPGYALLRDDCNDGDPRISPAREEICNGFDDDCEGTVDQPGKPDQLMFQQPWDGVTEFECKGIPGWEVKQCPPGRLDCDKQYKNACETIGTTLCNCHKCGRTCAFSCGETTCEEISALSTGDTHTCAIVTPKTEEGDPTPTPTGGKVACWGRNARGQLGDGTTRNSLTPVLVQDVAGATAIALGENHSCAIAFDSRIQCWGSNDFGQLGAASKLLQSVDPLDVRSPVEWPRPTRLASGTHHTCAIYEQGLLACWGRNDWGQLGNGDEGPKRLSNAPDQVVREVDGVRSFIRNATQVVAGELHTCALSAGKVECWGDNGVGQLGESPDTVLTRPVARPVPGLEAIVVDALAAAAFHTCARSGTDVYCWGNNYFGELANADETLTAVTKIELPSDVVSIAAGRFFGCALSTDGTARCWGSNEFGQRGSADQTPGVAPTPIPLPNIAQIFAGDGRQVCARTNDARTSCWGKNDFGQLGNGTQSGDAPQPTPKRVSPLNNGQTCSN